MKSKDGDMKRLATYRTKDGERLSHILGQQCSTSSPWSHDIWPTRISVGQKIWQQGVGPARSSIAWAIACARGSGLGLSPVCLVWAGLLPLHFTLAPYPTPSFRLDWEQDQAAYKHPCVWRGATVHHPPLHLDQSCSIFPPHTAGLGMLCLTPTPNQGGEIRVGICKPLQPDPAHGRTWHRPLVQEAKKLTTAVLGNEIKSKERSTPVNRIPLIEPWFLLCTSDSTITHIFLLFLSFYWPPIWFLTHCLVCIKVFPNPSHWSPS